MRKRPAETGMGGIGRLKWFQTRKEPAAAAVQLRETGRHPFGELGSYAALRSGEIRLYRAVREAVPVVDAYSVRNREITTSN